jgi:biotin operon repressor
MPKDTRDKVTLSPEAYKALEVEAMLHGDSLKDTASKLILKAACPKCKEILDIMARPPKSTKEEEPKGESDNGPKGKRAQGHNDTLPQGPEVMQTQEQNVTMSQEPKGNMTKGPKGPTAQIPDSSKAKRQRLSQNQVALAKIKELWIAGEHNAGKIAKEIGYPKATTWENIKKLKEKGELNAVHSDAIS